MLTAAIVLTPTVLFFLYLVSRTLSQEKQSANVLQEATASGLTEPASLHPVVDEARCIGCGSCVEACPEQKVLGLMKGKARLIGPSHCIGHGACKAACPTDALTLVFGTATRGVDIPNVRPNFETNVPGIFIAGELGGMGLIRNAFEQGRQAVESIKKRKGHDREKMLDLVVVGAGPAGISASLAAMQHGLRFVTLEQDTLGGTVAHYPRGKIVMTRPGKLPLVGKVKFTEITKEELLDFVKGVERETGLEINYKERVESVSRNGRGFVIKSSQQTYAARSVLLAIGRRGTPRRLGVPGEDRDKVTYRLIDPERFQGQRVLVVGGGDSALEAATVLAGAPGTTVTLSYRSMAFNRAKPKNRQRVEEAASTGRLNVLLGSKVLAVHDDHVELERHNGPFRLQNDMVIICAGGILPTAFLEQIGIELETKFGTA